MKRSLIFPGQGVQTVGMGKDLYDTFACAREVFEEVDHALGQKLTKLMMDGDQAELTLTSNAQPAIMAVSMAALRVLETEGKVDIFSKFTFAAGHSLGEYSALCAAGVFDLQTTAKLLKIRGEAMERACPTGLGAMVALLGGSFEKAEELAKVAAETQVCVVANDNSNEQIVLSGHCQAIDRASAKASEFGFKRAIKLAVSTPFHSPLMENAAKEMATALDAVQIKSPHLSIIPNMTAQILSSESIRDLLVDQICGKVRWRETMITLEQNNVTQVFEMGQGKVLSGLAKRAHPDIQTFSLQTPSDLETIIAII